MKLRLLMLLAVAALSLVFGRGTQPALAQSGNETAPSIAIGTGNGPPVQSGNQTSPISVQPGNGPPVGGTSGPTSNQTVKFKNVDLWVNPEYDDPRLLVMMEGQLDGATAPVTVEFLVPTAAEMYSAGSKDPTGTYSGGPPNRTASSIPGYDLISYTLTQQTFRVEYYNPVIPATPDKKFFYDFLTVAPITDLTVFVQQPKQSSNYVITPTGTAGVDAEGFNIFTYRYNNLTAHSTPVHFDISYTRTVTAPSIKSGGGTSSSMGLILAVIAAVVVIGGGALWMIKSRQTRYTPVRGSNKKSKGSKKKGNQGTRFCTKCGEPAGPDDKFCPSCGTKLRGPA